MYFRGQPVGTIMIRIIIVVKLDIMQSEGAIIRSPKISVAKSLSKEQGPNLPANAAQTNSRIYSIQNQMFAVPTTGMTDNVTCCTTKHIILTKLLLQRKNLKMLNRL